MMPLTIEATYENGMLRPTQPLPLKEREKVQITVQPVGAKAQGTSDEFEASRKMERQ